MAYNKYSPGEYRPSFGGFSFFPPVIRNLILINGAAFLLQQIFDSGLLLVGGTPLTIVFRDLFYLQPIGQGFWPWQLVTYMFLHGNFMHVFMNMLMLWMFGMEVENTWGSKKFLIFYFSCGIAAGLSNLLIAPLFTDPAATLGASGGVYGVLVAFAMLFPNRYVYIYFLLPVKAKYLITFLIALEVFYGTTGLTDGIAHMAHLGGAVLGGIWVLLDQRGKIDSMLGRLFARRSRRVASGDPVRESRVREAQFFDLKPEAPRKSSGHPDFDRNQKIIDDILDKISKEGYSGLTEEEKRILLDASKKIHPDRGYDA
ncbi:MAG: rhomboid family intramembrane serine protease [Ignavibacteria bacterium]|nr:rhomboid family intramembrane serine protease [Ignavibacteria bacterium]